jgi:hypothetical protein
MSRFLAVVVFVVALASGSAAFAQHGRGHENGGHSVPELSGGAGAAAGLILVGGVAAIVFARRRTRKPR